jgi:phage-related protein
MSAAWNYFQSHSLSEIGTEMINGLVGGLKAAGHLVLETLTNIVTGAVKGVKKYLGIASESKLMKAEVGYELGAGTAGGLDKSRGEVSDAAEGMVEAGVKGAKGATGGASSGPAGNVYEFNNCTFGGDLNESAVRKMMQAVFDAEMNAAAVAS